MAGLGHLLIFYGFLVLFIGTAILAFQDNVAKPLLDFDFWHGWFYLGYSLFLDLFERIAGELSARAYHAYGESRTLVSVRDALLPKLISGRVRPTSGRVPDGV